MLGFFRRVWSFARPYSTRLVLGQVCGILFALANGLLFLIIKLVIDLIFSVGATTSLAAYVPKAPALLRPLLHRLVEHMPELKSPTSRLGLVLVVSTIPAVMLLRGVFSYLNIYLVNWAAMRAIADLRTRLFDHLQNLSLEFFSRARTGELISRTTNDTQTLYGIVGNSFASIIRDPVTVLVLLAVNLSQQPKLTLLSMVVLPACLIPLNIYSRKARKSARASQGHVADLTSVMHESFTGNRIIKAYNLEETVLGQFIKANKQYVSQQMRLLRFSEFPGQLTEFLGALAVALVLLFADRSATSVGSFTTFVLSIVMVYKPVKDLTRLYTQLHQAEAASQFVFGLLDTTSTIKDPIIPEPLKAEHADIHFEDIHFNYGEKPVLRGINLRVKAGQLMALVGKTGSGKTSLTNLLLRFYDPQGGAVCIGGRDIRNVAIKDLRREIALVAQETILFNESIRHNIVVGRPGATDAEVEAAAKHAHAHEFIIDKPNGYDTIIGEKGVALSGGQRQRLAIARAILKNAPILILDEATNALDAEKERAVQAALEELMEGRTTICIAHRLSTIQKADLIVVLDNGRIIETGTHEQLIQARGTYCKLYELQFEPAIA